MWRRFGDLGFAAVVAVVLTAEALPLVWLTWTVLGGEGSHGRLLWVLLGGVATAALGLAVVTVYLLAYQMVSDRRAAAVAEARARWVVRWLRVLSGSEPAPDAPLPRPGVEALLELREAVRGAEAEHLLELLRRYGVSAHLEGRVRGRRLVRRLQALEDLARARAPEAMPILLAAVIDPDPRVQVAAARAAARTLADVADPGERAALSEAFAGSLVAARLPFGVVEEALLLADEAAAGIVETILRRGDVPARFARAALDAVARLGLHGLGDAVVSRLEHHDPEVRAAALRAVSRLGWLPEEARGAVRQALEDAVAFVRIHAAAAAVLLPREEARELLWWRLGDPSWWVRRAAAEALAGLGREGLAALGRAARTHPDRYARDMAAQVIRDRAEQVLEEVVAE